MHYVLFSFYSYLCNIICQAKRIDDSETMNEQIRKPTVHSMKRRSNAHDYSHTGCYHITISVARTLHQPFGRITGLLDKPDGDKDAPHVELSPIGRMVEEELLESIHRFYPMLEVQDYVIMPEHLHFLLVAHSDVVALSGNATHLGHVIAGFKYGCNKRYWAMTGKIGLTTESPGTLTGKAALGTLKEKSVLGDSVAKDKLPPLFEAGFCDVMPVDEQQLVTQRAYIHANPRSRLLRMTNRSWLHSLRHSVYTAVSISALYGYLQRECLSQLTPESFTMLTKRLLQEKGQIVCDSYGKTELLKNQLFPVVCHRRDKALFEQQKARCLAEAALGGILVSACISKGEQDIIDSARLLGYPVIRIVDNGFPEIYHPSADNQDDCAAGLLLLLTPWSYQFRKHDENITVLFCKTMNCIAQAVCRKKDRWWKEQIS